MFEHLFLNKFCAWFLTPTLHSGRYAPNTLMKIFIFNTKFLNEISFYVFLYTIDYMCALTLTLILISLQ